MELISKHLCFGGEQFVYSHQAKSTASTMRFGIYLPPILSSAITLPVVYWLSGLTCTEENFIVKAGAQRVAAALGIVIVVPDTSPRVNLPGDKESYDFGQGASFYLNAKQSPWDKYYQMQTYLSHELPTFLAKHFPIDQTKAAVMGHSMGGHGALTLALTYPQYYRSVSAFAPIVSTIQSPWGEKALKGYLGEDRKAWEAYDVVSLIREKGWSGPALLIDQGSADPYLQSQLKPHLLEDVCKEKKVPLKLRIQEGYDHSYFFIASFIEDHLRYHAANLAEIK